MFRAVWISVRCQWDTFLSLTLYWQVWGGSPKVPLVVRLQGNNVEGAMELMKNSGIECILGEDRKLPLLSISVHS